MAAVFGCSSIAVAYVALLYAISPLQLPRSHPYAIKQRMKAVLLACAVSWVPLFVALGSAEQPETMLDHLGLRFRGCLPAALLPLLLTAVLFAGPIYFYMLEYLQHGVPFLVVDFKDMAFLRNVIVAPVVEEFCFRACMVPLLLLQGWSGTKVVLVTPLFFGAAHLHHLRERAVHEGVPLASALAMVLFQFSFTTVFGWYATYLFVRTRNLLAPALVHAFCNALGFPPLGEMLQHKRRVQMVVLLVLGITGFCCLLQPMTEPSLYH